MIVIKGSNKLEKFMKALKLTLYETVKDKITWIRFIIASIFVYFAYSWFILSPFSPNKASDSMRFTITGISFLFISLIAERTYKKIK